MQLTKTKYINIAIMFIITFVVAILPPFGAITPFGMKVLGVFLGVLYGWLTVDLLISSIWGFAALGLFGIMTTTKALSTGLGNEQVVVVIAAMAFTGALDAVGVTKSITNWILTRNAFIKSPWLLVIGMTLTAFLLGLAGASLPGVLMLWSVINLIAEKNSIPKGDPLVSFMLMIVTIGAFCGMFALPFHAITLIFTTYFIQAVGHGFAVMPFITVAFASFLVTIAGMIILAKFVFRLDAKKFIMPNEVIAQMKAEKVDSTTKFGLIVLVFYIAGIVLPATFTKMPGAAVLSSLGIGGVSIIGMMALGLISAQSMPIVDLVKTWQKSIDWSLILLVAVTFPIAGAMTNSETGIMPTIMGITLPIFKKMGLTMFIFVTALVLGILTQFTHNIVLAAMFTSFLIPICGQLGGNIYTYFMVMFFTLNASYVTPAASFQSALVHGHERMSSKWGYILGMAYLLLTWIVNFLITIPLGNMLFK